MQKRNVLNSSRLLELKKHRKRAIEKKVLFLVFGFLIICTLLTYISRLSALNINNIEISGNQVIDTDAIKGVVEGQIAGNYLWIFPKTNIFFYPEKAITNELQDKFPRLKDINLSIKDNKILEVSVAERKALYTWCGIMPLPNISPSSFPTEGNKCYFIDENGYIFDEAPYFSGEVYFKFYGTPDAPNSSDIDFNPLGFYFSKQNFKQLISFRDLLVSFGLKPTSLYITTDKNVDVFLSSGVSNMTGPEIILQTDSDFQKVAENLEAALTTEPLQSEFKNKYSSLLYIDLRFGNKVYYKFSTPITATK